MKFLAFALVAITGVSAASTTAAPPVVSPADGDPNCLANYIVRQCLFTETAKLEKCDPLDYQCQCYANQAIATCYNNCPSDIRAPVATQAMDLACRNAKLYGKSTTATATAESTSAAAETSSSITEIATGAFTTSSNNPSKTNGAESFAGNAVGVLAAVAGAVAVVL